MQPDPKSSAFAVFRVFLKLGLTSFGGPIAHLAYFRREFVEQRRWLSEQRYAELLALCQFLPGPASSQVGFAIGLQRAGLRGGLAAWAAFTLPSAAMLVLFAGIASSMQTPLAQSAIHGLKLVAVAVVAHALWGMAQKLCPDRTRAAIALLALSILALYPGGIAQLGVIALGALLGLRLCQASTPNTGLDIESFVSPQTGRTCLLLFAALLGGLPLLSWLLPTHSVQLFDGFYRAGAMVFGGGHVVLPLLESRVVETGWVSADTFLAGYGAAQAIPGPLFTFAAYLGAADSQLGGVTGATLALCAIFLPGLLLLTGVLPFWQRWRQHRHAYPMMAGANAAVVGLLAATLYHPVWTSAVLSSSDFAIVASAFALLLVWSAPAWAVVLFTVIARIVIDML